MLPFFLAREIHASRLACPTNVVLLRFKRVWNNVETMIDIICALRNAFDPHIDRVQPISILNAAAIHLGGVSFCLMSAGCGAYVCCLQKLYSTRAMLPSYGSLLGRRSLCDVRHHFKSVHNFDQWSRSQYSSDQGERQLTNWIRFPKRWCNGTDPRDFNNDLKQQQHSLEVALLTVILSCIPWLGSIDHKAM